MRCVTPCLPSRSLISRMGESDSSRREPGSLLWESGKLTVKGSCRTGHIKAPGYETPVTDGWGLQARLWVSVFQGNPEGESFSSAMAAPLW